MKFGLNSLPTVVVISQTKKKFVNLVGMFDDKGIASFLDGVLSGKHGTSGFQELPQVCAAALCRTRRRAHSAPQLNKRACGEVIAEIQAAMAPQPNADEVMSQRRRRRRVCCPLSRIIRTMSWLKSRQQQQPKKPHANR